MNDDYLEVLFLDAVFTARNRKAARVHRDTAYRRRRRAMDYPPASWDARRLRARADDADRAAERASSGDEAAIREACI